MINWVVFIGLAIASEVVIIIIISSIERYASHKQQVTVGGERT